MMLVLIEQLVKCVMMNKGQNMMPYLKKKKSQIGVCSLYITLHHCFIKTREYAATYKNPKIPTGFLADFTAY